MAVLWARVTRLLGGCDCDCFVGWCWFIGNDCIAGIVCEAAFFVDWTGVGRRDGKTLMTIIIMAIARRCMGNVFWIGNRSSDRILRGNTCFGESIIARIKVFPLLLHLHKNTLMRRQLAIPSKQLLLLGGQLAEVDLLTLSREHDGEGSNKKGEDRGPQEETK